MESSAFQYQAMHILRLQELRVQRRRILIQRPDIA
jgi:hypothetical protein